MDIFCIHFVYIYYYFYYPLATTWQPRTLGLISRDRIGPIAPVANFPGEWYNFSINSGTCKAAKKESPGMIDPRLYISIYFFQNPC